MKFQAGPASLWETAAFDPVSAAISVGGSLIGGALSGNAAKSAASTQAAAANNAAAQSQAQYQQTRADLQPFVQAGYGATNALNSQLGQLTSQFNPTQAQLEATPGYQFNLSQGLQGVQNSAAARGLGISGAALKGAAQYATGLADNTLQTQFNIDQANKTNAFNKLLSLTQTGANAAATTGQQGLWATQNAGNFSTSGAAATAAGDVGAANALTKGLTGAGSAYNTYALLNNPTVLNNLSNANKLTTGYI